MSFEFEYLTSVTLNHDGDCTFLGVTPDLIIYVEEFYGSDGWLAQTAFRLDGTIVACVDEDEGRRHVDAPLPLPDDLAPPQRGWHTMRLNFAGARQKGLKTPERLNDLVQPITLQDKFALETFVGGQVTAPQFVGVAESYVLAEAALRFPNLYFVCRRIRIAYALPEERLDDDGQPFDYDTQVIYAAHLIDLATADPALSTALSPMPGAALHHPMDCLLSGDHLLIADGGGTTRANAVHVWKLYPPPAPRRIREPMERKLYG